MRTIYLYFALMFIISCTSSGSKNQTTTKISTDSLESDYIKDRNAKVEQFRNVNWSTANDSIQTLERNSLLILEKKLSNILKTSTFAGEGKIHLITLFQSLDFGLLDGLSIIKDSIEIVSTTQKIFLDYFKDTKLNSFDSLTAEELENIFQNAFTTDFRIKNFTTIRLKSSKEINAYGQIAMGYQMEGPGLPDFLFVLVSKGNFIYLFERYYKKPFIEISKCKSVWDSVYAGNFSNLRLAWEAYYKCYQNEIKNDTLFNGIKKQLQQMLFYIDKK